MEMSFASNRQIPQKEVLILVGILLLVLVGVGLARSSSSAKPDAKTYQAVFLTNGQVYFGKLSSIHSDYVHVEDIYYLRTNQNPQKSEENQPRLSLIKLGSELHGPEDAMYIAKEQILFWENLKADSQVVKSIEEQKAQATADETAKKPEDTKNTAPSK